MKKLSQQQIREIADLYNNPAFRNEDPVRFPVQYTNKRDVEISAVVTSWLSFGSRQQICNAAEKVDKAFDGSPSTYLSSRKWEEMEDGALYRMLSVSDLKALFSRLSDVYLCYNSLEDFVLDEMKRGKDLLSSLYVPFAGVNGFADPDKGSACKRFSLLLRWLVRNDGIVDLGIWTRINPASLLIPVDTHVQQVASELGIVTRKAANRKTAEEITAYMAKIFPGDPCKGDFALFGLGIDPDGDLPKKWAEEAANLPEQSEDEAPEEENPADDLRSFVESSRGSQRPEEGKSLLVDTEENKSREISSESVQRIAKDLARHTNVSLKQAKREAKLILQGIDNPEISNQNAARTAIVKWTNKAMEERTNVENRKEDLLKKAYAVAVERNQTLMVATTYNVLFANHIATEATKVAVKKLQEFGLLKMESKKQAKDLLNVTINFERRAMSVYGPNAEFLKGSIKTIMDEIAFDVEKVYYAIKGYLDKLRINNSDPISRLEQARCLLALAVDIHVQRFGFLRSKEPSLPPLDYMKLDKVLRFCDALSDSIVKGIGRVVNLNDDRNCVLSIDVLDRKLSDEDRIARAIALDSGLSSNYQL